MSTVLALEPDDRRTGLLRAVVCEQLRASLVVANTSEAAFAAISAHMPDVVLVSPDFPPREEIEIKDYLRSLQRSPALEIIKMPAPSRGAPRARTGTGLLGAFRKRAAGASEKSAEKDDSAALASRIAGALDRVGSARANASTRGSAPEVLPEWRAAPEPDPGTCPTSDSSKPGFTLHASRSDEGVGDPPTTPAAPGRAGLALPDVADGEQDEWGFFDASRCGYAALAATLGTLPEEVQQNVEPSPADMLLKLEAGTDPAVRPQPPAVPASTPTCQRAPTAVLRERRRGQPAPLALWAHLFGPEGECSAPSTLLRYTEAMAGVAALLVGLNIPAQIAGVVYGSGCRVHRVRGLTRTELTAADTFEVASSQPDSSSISHPAVSEASPAV